MNIIFLKQDKDCLDGFYDLIKNNHLPLTINEQFIGSPSNKTLKELTDHYPDTLFLLVEKQSLMLISTIEQSLVKIGLNWQSLQSRIVKAGKNSELLLKIAKLNNSMRIIDATAGFGVDGLILASTGAKVSLIEKNPLIFLMLTFEYQKMSYHNNWQKLLQRIDIHYGDSSSVINTMPCADLIYLDPMFPLGSYKGAVNKHMQLLHTLIDPPSDEDEKALFSIIRKNCQTLIIKRPIIAPYFSAMTPTLSLSNDMIRFDKYTF